MAVFSSGWWLIWRDLYQQVTPLSSLSHTPEMTIPPTLARWDCQTLAEDLGVSKHAVWRALKKEGTHLHRAWSWCVSTDPEFAEKSAAIIGL